MIMPQTYLSCSSPSPSCVTHIFQKPCLHGTSYYPSFQVGSRPWFQNKRSERRVRNGYNNSSNKIKAVAVSLEAKKVTVKVKATITVQLTVGGAVSHLKDEGLLDYLSDIWTDITGKTLFLELVSTTLNPKTKREKDTIKGYASRTCRLLDKVKYEGEYEVPHSFGEIGAIFVENEHHKEMFITDVVFEGFPTGTFNISCNSWVHSKFDNPAKRVFFSNKSYLPSETPKGLKRIRGEKLRELRGNGEGERKKFERIYDYDVYNDIGDPDTDIELKRPVLGGKQNPYPRRCRTGRPRCKTDQSSEALSKERVYVPRDECFSEIKDVNFAAKTIYTGLHALIPSLRTTIVDKDLGFPVFSAIDDLFNEGIKLPILKGDGFIRKTLPRLIKLIEDVENTIHRFETPATMDRDRFFWFRDEEFARQTLAGSNPFSIQLVTEWPLKSKLDPDIYGPVESAFTTETIEREIRGFITVEEAIKQKKLFILDYHDLLLPVVEKVRELEGTTLYGSRTLFLLNDDSTLSTLAIELTRPPINGKPQWKEVFTPSPHSTGEWLWRLAKAHVLAHDSGYHQLISHWLRTHCATEPYIIATNRQLSAMHPIYRLLHPHFRYTMEINALAREKLINANGSIESSFSPEKYSMQLSSIIYDKQWQFDLQALPADLINRGLAVEDPNSPHGLKLTIEDFPYANDGLILWDAIKGWVTDYVNHYYTEPGQVESDNELQAWWEEIRTVGHGDKKDEPWWPVLKTNEDLVQIVTTIAWVTSGHHSAVNFGQYHYAGYFPNRPSITRCNMPTEDPSDSEWELFMKKPEATLLNTFPNQIQAITVMTVMDILSTHSTDEEYLGETLEPAWAEVPTIKSSFEKFKGKLMELEGIVDERNADMTRKNRNGAGILPYELFKPKSDSGVTGKGLPYSISI